VSLLGVDVGTTGCKAAAYSEDGLLLALHYEGYHIQKPEQGWAQLDTTEVWEKVKLAIRSVALQCREDRIKALSVSSLGEAVVPVTKDHKILGPSILNFDQRGNEFLPTLQEKISADKLYSINGNILGNQYGLTKLMWINQHQPDLYQRADKFLLWSSFIAFMLGGEPTVDYSLANRMLLFDLDQCDWSDEMLGITGLDRSKLPDTAPSGTKIGRVSNHIAEELNLPQDVIITTGAHDQNAAAVGCGVIEAGRAVYGMGTFICVTPVINPMIQRGLNTEHHAVPERYVSFIYNQGGSIVRWFRNTFADQEDQRAAAGEDEIYDLLFSEIPDEPSSVVVLPHFTITGPPHFISDSSGVIAGLNLETSRGDILKGILEGVTFSLKEVVDSLTETGFEIQEYRPVGGGSKSEAWIQTSANILGKPFKLPVVKEAGTLGAAIIAGVGSGVYPSFEEGVESTVKVERTFEPDMEMHQRYQVNYQAYQDLWLLMGDYLRHFEGLK
jgi:xylulokinase